MSISYIDYGEFEGLDEHARNSRSFSADDLILSVFGGYLISSKIKIGVGFKYFKEETDSFTATSYNTSVGITGEIDDHTQYGVVIRNAGTGLTFINETNPVPFVIAMGATRKVNKNLNVLGHVKFSIDVPVALYIGGEYCFNDLLFLRLGFRSDRAGFLSKFSTGIGVIYKGFSIDFGFSGYQNLGSKYVVSISYEK